jgi:hypothetical protein
MKDQDFVKGRYEHIRSTMAKYPEVTKAKLMRDLVIQEFNLKYNKEQKLTLRKTCWDVMNRRETKPALLPHTARILVFDIETAPIKTYVWRRWKQNISHNQTLNDDWPVLTWSAKWLCEDTMMRDQMTPKEALNRDDKRVVKSMWKLLEEADIVIAHNGKKFDTRMLNGRFWIHNMLPPAAYQVIDTLLSTRKSMALPSNKLDDLRKYKGGDGKIQTDMSWWTEFLEGKQEAIDNMAFYNDKDVLELEELYLDLRPWIKPHPNLGLFVGQDIAACPSCGGSHLTHISKPYMTTMNAYQQIRCDDCGSMSRSRLATNEVRADRKLLGSSLPR